MGKKTKQIPSSSTPTKWWTKWYKMVSFLITSHHNSPLAWLRLTVHRSSGSCGSHPSEPVGLGVFPKDSGFFCAPKMDGFKIMEHPYWILMDDLRGKLPPLLFGNILSYLHYSWQVQKMPENFQSRVFSWIIFVCWLANLLKYPKVLSLAALKKQLPDISRQGRQLIRWSKERNSLGVYHAG